MCPVGTAIPSESTVLFAFTPSICKNCKIVQVQISPQIQSSRQLRVSHIDEHFSAAQFRYMGEFAMKNKEMITSVDDYK